MGKGFSVFKPALEFLPIKKSFGEIYPWDSLNILYQLSCRIIQRDDYSFTILGLV